MRRCGGLHTPTSNFRSITYISNSLPNLRCAAFSCLGLWSQQDQPSRRLSASLLPFFSRSQSHSALSTSVLSQSQPPPNIPAYHVALDGFVLRSIGVECLTKHSRIEEAISTKTVVVVIVYYTLCGRLLLAAVS